MVGGKEELCRNGALFIRLDRCDVYLLALILGAPYGISSL
jgi:hypothetical protein